MKNDKYTDSARMLMNFLKSQAKEKAISESEISRRTGLQQQNVNRLFIGKYLPSLDNFLKIGEAIGVRLELHGETKSKNSTTRNIEVPKFLFAPDWVENELFILHTRYPACLIKLIQKIPAEFQVIESYDSEEDFAEILIRVKEYYQNYVEKSDSN
jgi:transcriptional regulator with XRE-family HTH domain